jgi:RNA-directed DNA polymerase
MPRTKPISLARIGDWHNVAWALNRAARGKRRGIPVARALARPERTIDQVSEALRAGQLPIGRFRAFAIRDPKRRLIHAADFLDRVAHHALVRFLEPVLEKALLPSVYACRVGKGVHAAVLDAQRQARRFRWVMHLDIAGYFPAIDHRVLRGQLRRRFRGDGLRLVDAVIAAHQGDLGRGLPIGALTSQHFANHYLNDADRWCLAWPGIGAHLRYMDDLLLFAADKASLLELRAGLADYLAERLRLRLKPALIQRTANGFLFCGVRIRPYALRPSLRRRRRYRAALRYWEQCWQAGAIGALELQRAHDAAHAILLPADDPAWRRHCLAERGMVDA